MNISEACPKVEKCPIFLKSILHSSFVEKTYKTLYCLAGKEKYQNCKRFMAAEKYKKPVPENILPNSTLSLEEIGERMNIR